jgi:hypothetical protein
MANDFLGILKSVAPGLATALLGPLGGMAVTAIGSALGVSEPTQEKIQQALSGATPEDLLKVKQAEQQFQKDMRALDIDLERISASDRDSARKMAVETKAWTPAVLSWLIIVATLGLEGYILVNGVPAQVNDLVAGRILGTLDMAFMTVLTFWLGTSNSSRNKDATISKLSN